MVDKKGSGFAGLRYMAPRSRKIEFWLFLAIFFLPIFIPRQFVISPYSNSGLGADSSGQTDIDSHSTHGENIT